MDESETEAKSSSVKTVSSGRVRFGIILWIVSYLPFPVVIAGWLHESGKLTDAKSTSTFIAVSWGIQFAIGFVGLYIAGKEAITMVKDQGIKKLPKNLWYTIIGRKIS